MYSTKVTVLLCAILLILVFAFACTGCNRLSSQEQAEEIKPSTTIQQSNNSSVFLPNDLSNHNTMGGVDVVYSQEHAYSDIAELLQNEDAQSNIKNIFVGTVQNSKLFETGLSMEYRFKIDNSIFGYLSEGETVSLYLDLGTDLQLGEQYLCVVDSYTSILTGEERHALVNPDSYVKMEEDAIKQSALFSKYTLDDIVDEISALCADRSIVFPEQTYVQHMDRIEDAVAQTELVLKLQINGIFMRNGHACLTDATLKEVCFGDYDSPFEESHMYWLVEEATNPILDGETYIVLFKRTNEGSLVQVSSGQNASSIISVSDTEKVKYVLEQFGK